MSTASLQILGFHENRLYPRSNPRIDEWRAVKPDRRLGRRMQPIERTNAREKRQVLQLIDAFIERDQLRSAKR